MWHDGAVLTDAFGGRGMATAVLCLLSMFGCARRVTPRKMSLQEVAAIDFGDAFHEIPMETTAVVLYTDPEWHLLFVADGGVSMYIAPPPELKLKSGDRVRIVGRTSKGEGIASPTFEVLSEGNPLPEAIAADPRNYAAVASHWVRLTGQVRWAGVKNGRAAMQVASQGVESPVYLLHGDAEKLPPIGSEIAVTGVAAAQFHNGKIDGAQIMTPSLRSVEVLKRGPAEPFLLPLDNGAAERGEVRDETVVHLSGQLHSADTNSTISIGKASLAVTLAAPAFEGDYLADVVGFWSAGRIEDAIVRAAPKALAPRGSIRHIAELKRFTAARTAVHLPVSVRGVVTYHDPDWGLLFVQEKDAGIFVDVHNETLQLKPGDRVQIDGESSLGDFAPSIVDPLIAVLGHGALPQPAQLGVLTEDLDAYDSRWCTIRGIVHAVQPNAGHTLLRVRSGGSDLIVTLPEVIPGTGLVDREVAISGTFGVLFNDRKQKIGNQMFTPSLAFIRPVGVAPAGATVYTIGSLQRYNPNLDTRHSIVVHGVVVLKSKSDDLYVQDNTGGIEVRGVGPFNVSDGDEISVRGFVVLGDYSPVLEDAVLAGTAGRAVPHAVAITPAQALTGAYDEQFVAVQGLVGNISTARGSTTFDVTAAGTAFSATGPAASTLTNLRPGSTIAIRGICHVLVNRLPVSIRGFNVIFDSPAAITVVRPGPWWTATNIGIAVLLLVALAAAVLAWAAVLRRKVYTRTLALRSLLQAQTNAQKFDSARNAVLEGIANNEPIALNMHRLAVSVEQQIPGAMCVIVLAQSQVAQHHEPSMQSHFVIAPGTSDAARTSMQTAVNADGGSDPQKLDELLTRLLEIANGDGGPFTGGAVRRIDNTRRAASDIIALLFKAHRASELAEFEGMVLQSAAHLVSIAQNHSEIHHRLLHDAYHDAMTGLPNRTLVEDRLEHARARCERKKTKLTVLCIDLDGFKQVNDSMGHAAGDALLREVSSRLQSHIRRADTVGRMGGDEFMAVLEDCTEAAAACQVAESLLATIRQPVPIEGTPVQVSASIGAALYPAHGETLTELKRHADQAMYTAKVGGGNRVSLWSPELRSATNIDTENLLRRALEERLFELRYQPIVDANGRAVAVEALLRLRAPEGRLLSPAEFIDVAEESGLIVPIGEWVLEESCRQVKKWGGVPVAVNASARQFAIADFSDVVAGTLNAAGIAPEQLELELTETVVMHDVSGSRRQMEKLKRLGVRIAVDDFGTGHSSLNYLHKLPIDILKIDRSFCASMNAPGGSKVIIDAVIQIARTFGMITVAEGVESTEQFTSLLQAGCDRFQGYLFAKPMTADEIAVFVRSSVSETTSAGEPAPISSTAAWPV